MSLVNDLYYGGTLGRNKYLFSFQNTTIKKKKTPRLLCCELQLSRKTKYFYTI